MFENTKKLAVLAVLVSLTACGTSKTDRALSGGAIGAGAGALLGGTSGAIVGGAAGAAAGGLTDEDDIDLGKPVWR
jgi:hypothetical protein